MVPSGALNRWTVVVSRFCSSTARSATFCKSLQQFDLHGIKPRCPEGPSAALLARRSWPLHEQARLVRRTQAPTLGTEAMFFTARNPVSRCGGYPGKKICFRNQKKNGFRTRFSTNRLMHTPKYGASTASDHRFRHVSSRDIPISTVCKNVSVSLMIPATLSSLKPPGKAHSIDAHAFHSTIERHRPAPT